MSNYDKFDLGAFEAAMASLANLMAAETLAGNATNKKAQDAIALVLQAARDLDQAQFDREEAARLEREAEREAELERAKNEEASNLPYLVQALLVDTPFSKAYFTYTVKKQKGGQETITSQGVLLVPERGVVLPRDVVRVYAGDGMEVMGSRDKGSFLYVKFSNLTLEDLGARGMSFYTLVDTRVLDQGLECNNELFKALAACEYRS